MDLKLNSLCSSKFWCQYGEKNTDKIPLIVVYPSGRASIASSGHLALISDALFTPEIVVKINEICCSTTGKRLLVRSMLDIDYYDQLYHIRNGNIKEELENEVSIINSNLFILATADINVVTKILLDESKSIETYNIGYKRPFEDCIIIGGEGKKYAVMAYPNIGVLGLYKVPWSKYNRFAIISGGILAPGTLASNILLYGYLKTILHGNNKYNPEVPVKIVSSSVKDYHNIKLIPTAECIPQHEMRNITHQIKIHE